MPTKQERSRQPLQDSLDALLAEAEAVGVFTEPYRERIEAVRQRLIEEIEDAKGVSARRRGQYT